MSTLDSVLAYKARKDAEAAADFQSIQNAISAFETGRQNAKKSALDELTLRVSGATHGLAVDPTTGTIKRDDSLTSPLDQFLQLGKVAEARKNLMELGIGSGATGGGESESGQDDLIPTEFNIAGVPTKFKSASAETKQDDIKNQSEARKNLDDYAANANEALTALDKIEKAAEGLGDFKRGVFNQAKAKTQMAAKSFGKNEAVSKFQGMLSQELSPLARKLSEEKGPLTNTDIDRIIKGVGGDLTMPLSDKKVLLNELRTKIHASFKNRAQIAKLSDKEISAKYKDLFNRINRQPSQTQEVSSIPDGTLGKAKDGTPVVRRGNKWVPRRN